MLRDRRVAMVTRLWATLRSVSTLKLVSVQCLPLLWLCYPWQCLCCWAVQHEKMKFLVIATKNNTIEIYAWAQKPYSKFMLFKQFQVEQSPHLVGMVCDSANRQKALYASHLGFHSIDLDTEVHRPIYTPTPVSEAVTCMWCNQSRLPHPSHSRAVQYSPTPS